MEANRRNQKRPDSRLSRIDDIIWDIVRNEVDKLLRALEKLEAVNPA